MKFFPKPKKKKKINYKLAMIIGIPLVTFAFGFAIGHRKSYDDSRGKVMITDARNCVSTGGSIICRR